MGINLNVFRADRSTHKHKRWLQPGVGQGNVKFMGDLLAVARLWAGIGAARSCVVISDDLRQWR